MFCLPSLFLKCTSFHFEETNTEGVVNKNVLLPAFLLVRNFTKYARSVLFFGALSSFGVV